ncbi:hypothetical protein OIU74_011271 [Salix koriyanagi]|uniref:Uncharacterized protein n=1 Tax=Salix koriyanagi TaxID=2511006 RepID=A0A9Q0TEX1_9ROSI|nr:hypothetical protein OIU74_011271 [Salix koriyanagi]
MANTQFAKSSSLCGSWMQMVELLTFGTDLQAALIALVCLRKGCLFFMHLLSQICRDHNISAGRCWTLGEERIIVKNIIQWWALTSMKSWSHFLCSFGGLFWWIYFVSALATNLRFSSITIMIAEGVFDQMNITVNYPPTLFVTCLKIHTGSMKISEFIEVHEEHRALMQKRLNAWSFLCHQVS